MIPNLGNSKPGKLISQEEFFSMEATDMSGNVWAAKGVSVSNSFSIPASGKVIKSTIRSLSCEKGRKDLVNKNSSFLFLVIPGKHNIPCNKWEDLANGGKSLNICKLSILSIDLEIKERKNCLTIKVEDSHGTMDINFKELLVEALNIVFGKLCPILYSKFTTKEINAITIASIPSSVPNQKIATLIKHSSPGDVLTFTEFIEKYIKSFEREHDVFFGYWHKINRSWQGGIESAALTICTAIEGITKNYYSEYGLPDNEIVQQAEDAKPLIKDLTLGKRIKNRVLSSIGQVKSTNPKNALYRLAEEGKVEQELVDSWVSLRNKSAHADNLDDNIQEQQKYIDEVFKCQNLFNVLLLLKIEFNGKYLDLSKEGWPENSLPVDAEPETRKS